MKELKFIRGGGLRTVRIVDRKICLISAELNFQPIEIDLDKLDSEEYKEKIKNANFNEEDIKTLKKLAKLNSQEEIIKDIVKDFQKTGWRRI